VISGFHSDVGEICCLLDITQHRVVVLYWHFGTTYRILLEPWTQCR